MEFDYYVREREFYIWRLELWWIAFDSPKFYPEGRKHLFKNWFWRKPTNQTVKRWERLKLK